MEALVQLQAANKRQLARAHKNFELGSANIVDVHEAQMSHDKTSAQLVKAESNLGVAKHSLARITGRYPQPLKRLRDTVILALPVPSNVEKWVAAAEGGSFDVQLQEILADIARNKVQSRKAEHLPSIDMVISRSMQQSPTANTRRSESAAIGLRLSMPLFSGGRASSATREAVALQMQSDYDLQDARRAAALAAREAWFGVIDGAAQVKALEVAMISAQSAVDSNLLGYKVGVRVGADILEAQSQLSDITQQLAKARYDAVLAQLQLKAAAGTLTYNDLAEVNALLE